MVGPNIINFGEHSQRTYARLSQLRRLIDCRTIWFSEQRGSEIDCPFNASGRRLL